jgi:hypothetical protein
VQGIISSNEQESKLIRRVFVPRAFSYAVVQQPEGNPYYVSKAKDLVTEFSLPKRYGVIGLMAHNHLAGNQFERLTLGQEIQIDYEDGHTDRYIVSEITRFRALEPTNPDSLFEDLESGTILSAAELFDRMYTGAPHVTFQTCIYSSGDNSWGRLFVIATPATATTEFDDPKIPSN